MLKNEPLNSAIYSGGNYGRLNFNFCESIITALIIFNYCYLKSILAANDDMIYTVCKKKSHLGCRAAFIYKNYFFNAAVI